MGLRVVCALLFVALGAANEGIILRDKEVIDSLRQKSDPDTIPIDSKDPKPVTVQVKTSLLYVPAADEEAEVVEMVVRQITSWKNPSLAWSSRWPEVNNVSIPVRFMWLPDTAAITAVSVQEVLSPELAVVSADGEVTYTAQIRISIYGDLKGLSSPTGVRVSFPLESWTHDNSKFRFENPTPSSFALDEFESKRFQVSDPKVEKRTNWHPSRPSQHESLEFSFVLKSKE